MIGSIIADVIIFFFVEVIGKLLVGVYTFLKALLLSFKSFFYQAVHHHLKNLEINLVPKQFIYVFFFNNFRNKITRK